MNPKECIEELCNMFPQFQAQYSQFLTLYNRKLWYQLTEELLTFTGCEANYSGENMIRLFGGFISQFESRIDPLEYAIIVCSVSRQYYPDYLSTLQFIKTIGDVGEPKTVFRNHVENKNTVLTSDKAQMTRRDKIGENAYIRYVLDVAWLNIKLEKFDLGLEYLDELKCLLDGQPIPSPRLYSVYYRVSIELYRYTHDMDRIFTASLKWLVYTPLSSMTLQDKTVVVKDILKSALLSQDVYSFGELLTEEIRSIANQGGYIWLYELLCVVNKGDIPRWNNSKEMYLALMRKDTSMSWNIRGIDEKIAQLALLQLVFHRPTTSRVLRYEEICSCCQITEQEIEAFLIRGAGLGLFKCQINQLEKMVVFTWLQPRILDKEQINTMSSMLQNWSQHIHDTMLYITSKATEM